MPPAQRALEDAYRAALRKSYGIEFSRLICLTNMPIKRFAAELRAAGRLQDYMDLLVAAYNPATLDRLMCLDMAHVAYDGRLYDCDFNYALGLALPAPGPPVPGARPGLTVFDIESLAELAARRIRTGPHCFGCTAGSGSSCGGQMLQA